MYKKIIIIVSIILALSSCNDKASIVEDKVTKTKDNKQLVVKKSLPSTNNDVFKDSANISPNDKYMILIFGTNTCPYCMKLKEDISKSEELRNKLKNDYSSYYLKTHENLRHKLYHEKESMDVDTKTMISIYGIKGTPTIIFADKNGKAIFIVPGYMPLNQFLVSMDFVESKLWEGKDRKNGEIYQTLKDFYKSKNIIK